MSSSKRHDRPAPQVRQAWIESMLKALNPEKHEERIERAINQLGAVTHGSDKLTTDYDGYDNRVVWRVVAMLVSVLVAVVAVYQISGPAGSAMASVNRSLEASSLLIPRRYDLVIKRTGSRLGNYSFENQVFVLGEERFAMKHTGLGIDVWIGKAGLDEAWIVSPNGPVIKGTSSKLFEWLGIARPNLKLPSTENKGTPLLHVSTALKTMINGYELKQLPDEQIMLSDTSKVGCLHIRGSRKVSIGTRAPDSIDLWISHRRNIPIQIIAQWNSENSGIRKRGIKTVTLLYRDEPRLSDDWFTAEAHYKGPRRVVNLETLELN